ncbi:hypothetical protein E2C01_028708 [Portunus trituberculatus]|uniref:Uncharacterized protein n=1 Tax=Portunus trituberculatus TaxID=210409 RepID=A0A5B7EPR7_PORTR|nr:hypothetical protein [Portunus trituberculatus]
MRMAAWHLRLLIRDLLVRGISEQVAPWTTGYIRHASCTTLTLHLTASSGSLGCKEIDSVLEEEEEKKEEEEEEGVCSSSGLARALGDCQIAESTTPEISRHRTASRSCVTALHGVSLWEKSIPDCCGVRDLKDTPGAGGAEQSERTLWEQESVCEYVRLYEFTCPRFWRAGPTRRLGGECFSSSSVCFGCGYRSCPLC